MSPRSRASALSPHRWPIGRLAAGLLVLFALALLALDAAPPAQAQTVRTPPVVTLVSNTGQTSSANPFRFTNDYAQAFTTGSHADGYTLTRVDFLVQDGNVPEPTYTVKVHSDSSGSPGAIVGTLTNPANLPDSESITKFTNNGVTLEADTTYWVVFDISSVTNQAIGWLRGTGLAAEDEGALPGWSIADSYNYRGIGGATWTATTIGSLKLAIHGYARGHTIEFPTPVLQSLTLEADATTITLAYDQPLIESSVPATSAFSVVRNADLANLTVSSVDVTANEVKLTLSAAVTPSGTLTRVSYTAPSSNPIRSPGIAASFSNNLVNWAPVMADPTSGSANSPPRTNVSLDAGVFVDPDDSGFEHVFYTSIENSLDALVDPYANKDHRVDVIVSNPDAAWEVTSAPAITRVFHIAESACTIAGLMPPSPETHVNVVKIVATDSDGATTASKEFHFRTSITACWTRTGLLEVDGSTLTVTSHHELQSTQTNPLPSSNPFTVKVNGRVVSSTVAWTAGTGRNDPGKATLTLAEPASRHDTVTLSFTNPDGQLKFDSAPYEAQDFEDWHVTHAPHPHGPVFQSATADGTELKVAFEDELDSTHVPAAAAFTVTADGANVPVTGVSIGSPVTLTLASAVSANQAIRVAYNRHRAGASPLQDASGDLVPSFGAMPVNRASLRGEWFNIPFHRPVENYEIEIDDSGNYGTPVAGGCTENFSVRVDGELWPKGVTFAGERDGLLSLWRQVATDSNCDDLPHSVMFWTGEGEITTWEHQEIITGQHVTLTYDGPLRKPDGTFAAGLRYTDGAREPVPAFTVDVLIDHGSASVNGNILKIEFGVPLDESIVLDTSEFEVSSSHSFGRTIPVTSATISGDTVTLTLAESIPNHATVSLFFGNRAADKTRFYDDEDGDKTDGDPITSAIKDLDGNDLVYVPIRQAGPLFVYPGIPVKVLTPNTPPQVVAAGVDYDTQVILRFNEEMDTSAFAPGSAFTLTSRSPDGATSTIRVNGVPGWAGANLRLHLSSAPPTDATLTLSYAKPSASNDQLKDANGLALESFSNVPVNNGQPIITDVDIASDPGPDGVYTAGEKVQARLTFSDYVIVNTHNGTPRLRVHLGDFQPDLRWATFESGWGTNQLIFGYTLTTQDGEIGQSSLGVKQNSLDLQGGTIWSRYVRANRSAILSHQSFPQRPDPTPPTVTAVAIVSDPGSDRTYELGDVIKVGLTFSEPVYVDDTNVDSTNNDGSDDMPTIVIDLSNRAGDHRLAYYRSSEGGNQLIFEYIVTARDTSTRGVEVLENTLRLNGGLIKSHLAWSDHHADLSHPGLTPSSSHLVDPAPGAPTIMSVSGLANSSQTVTLIFNKELDTSFSSWPGSIAFDITVDGERRRVARDAYPHVDYDDGRIIRFEMAEQLGLGEKMVTYTKPSAGAVGSPLRDLFGNEVESFVWPIPVEPPVVIPPVTPWLWGANVIVRNMSRGLGRGCSEDASLCRYSFDNEFEYEDATYEITTLRQSGDVLGREVADDGSFYFALDQAWPADLRSNAAVCVGNARLELADAEFQSGNRLATWQFEDHEAALERVKARLAGDTVVMRLFETGAAADGTCSVTGQQQQPPTSPSTAAPTTVTAVAVTSDAGADDTYALGDVISIAVTFSGAVRVTGSPQITIDMDPADWGSKQATYASGSETATLTFTHTVVEPNYSSQGIAVLEDTLSLNGGAIRSMSSGKNADLSHDGLAHDDDHKVNWQTTSDTGDEPETAPRTATTPTVTAVAVTSDAGSDDTYALGDVIRITVTFSEAVDVGTSGGSPRLNIDMDPADWGTKWAAYEGGSGTTTLTFTHTVVEPNYSTQGIAVLEDTLELNGGSIESTAADADADLSHTGLSHDADHKVDWQQSGGAGS